MASNPPNAYRVGDLHSSPDTQAQEPTFGGVPEWAFTTHPRELAFYEFHLENLSRINRGISAIARTLIRDCESDDLDLGENIREGLLQAVEMLTERASAPIEFMQERAAQFKPNPDPTN